MNYIIEIFGIIASIFTIIAFFPQTVRVIQTKSTKDLSWWWIVLTTIGVFLWIFYGLLIISIGLILGNSIVFSWLIIIIRYKFVDKDPPSK